MSVRDSLLDNFAGDLEYHPRRGAVYLALALAAFCRFYFVPSESKLDAVPVVVLFGSMALLIKGIFFLRKSSEGIGLTESDHRTLSTPKDLPSMPNLVAQLVQDFGVGPLLLWPVLRVLKEGDASLGSTELAVLVTGAITFGLGWAVRRATRTPVASD